MIASTDMEQIEVATGRPYTVHVGAGCLEQVGPLVREACGGSKAAIMTDSNVGPLYASRAEESLAGAGYETCTFTFPAGEEHKRADTYLGMLEFLCAHEFGRKDVVVALGGGVVGDVAGFAAATYMRGIHLAQVPTSLLSMVDSSVGGKTAIDLEGGKNLAGAFWQPDVVLADIMCLATLSDAQFQDGCAEVIKHCVLADPDLFAELEDEPLTPPSLVVDPARVARIVARNICIKRDVVQEDEREQGSRKLLNLGHSIGHAVEAAEEYTLGHGNCVSIGLVAIARASAERGWCSRATEERIRSLLARHGLETSTSRTVDELMAQAAHDKKRQGATIDLVIPHAIGSCSIRTTSMDEFRELVALGLGRTGTADEGEEGGAA